MLASWVPTISPPAYPAPAPDCRAEAHFRAWHWLRARRALDLGSAAAVHETGSLPCVDREFLEFLRAVADLIGHLEN